MIRFLAVVALMAVSTVHATELKFGDLNYFFKKNEFNIGATGDTVSQEEQRGGKTREKEGYAINGRLNYAVTDRFYFSANIPYDLFMKVASKDVPSTHRFTQDGFENPRIGGNYRAIRQDDKNFNLDFGLFYKVKTEEEKRGAALNGAKTNGTAATGRNAAEFNVRLGRKWNEANEFYFLLGALYNFNGGYKQLNALDTSSVKVNQKSSMDYQFGALYQYRPVNEFMMSISGVATRYGVTKGTSQGLDYNTDKHVDVNFVFTAKYLVTEQIIARFNWMQGYRPDYGDGDVNVSRRHYHGFGFGFDFLF